MANEEIIELLANQHSRSIISLTSIKEYSAIQLSQELNIPLATVYRNLKLLETAGLIQHVKTIINLQGNGERFFRCAISEATIRINNGGLSVDVKKEERDYKIIRLWTRLAHPKIKDVSDRSL